MNDCGCVPKKLQVQKLVAGQIWFMGHRLPTPAIQQWTKVKINTYFNKGFKAASTKEHMMKLTIEYFLKKSLSLYRLLKLNFVFRQKENYKVLQNSHYLIEVYQERKTFSWYWQPSAYNDLSWNTPTLINLCSWKENILSDEQNLCLKPRDHDNWGHVVGWGCCSSTVSSNAQSQQTDFWGRKSFLHARIISHSESLCFLIKALPLFKMLKNRQGKIQGRSL